MHRRNLLTAAIRGACATPPIAPLTIEQARAEPARAAEFSRVAYHLSDLDKVEFVLGNIRNHYAGMGGPGHVTVELVVHGPALEAFEGDAASNQADRGIERHGSSAQCLHKHHAGAECDAEGSAARFHRRGERRGGAARRTAVAGLRLSAAVATDIETPNSLLPALWIILRFMISPTLPRASPVAAVPGPPNTGATHRLQSEDRLRGDQDRNQRPPAPPPQRGRKLGPPL